MRINFPRSTDHPITCLWIKLPDETLKMSFDDSHKTADIELPEGVTEDQVEIIAEFHDARNQRDERLESIIVKAKADPKDKGEGKGDETKTTGEVTNGPQIALTEPPKPKGRQARHNDKPAETPAVAADKPAEASTETKEAEKPAEATTEPAADKPVEKS